MSLITVQLMMVKIDFTTGLITNSSSEVFLANTHKTVEDVECILRDLWELYISAKGAQKKFEDAFGDIHAITSADLKVIATYKDYARPRYDDYPSFAAYKAASEKWLSDWVADHTNEYQNRICIYSASDNSIPYEMLDLIEDMFNGERIHLG